jgi:phosphotransferase system enzyme I (PtsI)
MRGRRLTEDAIVVAEELMPSTIAELDFAHIKAVATDVGGWTSHTAIIARGLGIPAVVGLRDFYRAARTGDACVIDARKGEVILHPTQETAGLLMVESRPDSPARVVSSEDLRAPLRTSDGVEILLRANVELPFEYEWVGRYGARGIGLFRSEFLLTHLSSMPNEEEQREAYEELARIAGEDGVNVRLFDVGGDKMPASRADGAEERNPALGLRAIRFCLRHEDIFRTQARAVLRAAARGRIDLVLPMISDVTDVRRARRILEEEMENLKREGRETGRVRVGAMIEVPSAVLVAAVLAREVDFFSLGTNDLVQYTLAVDRGNDDVADWFRSLHPAVLQSIARALEAASAAGIPSNVCGEMAASPAYAAVLIGLGARELSMAPTSLARVRHMVAGIEFTEVEELARECLTLASADEVEELVRVGLGRRWPNLFPPEILPQPKGKG